MLEMFECEGKIEIEASERYKDFGREDGQIVLEQKNYGGHFVVNS